VEQEKTPRERAEDLISLLVSDWRPSLWQGAWAIGIALVLGLMFAIGHQYEVTAWDWLKLLIVPAVIAAGGLWFNAQQRDREQNLVREHTRAEALQAYFDQMGRLLLDKDTQLGKSKEGDEARTLARAWTLTVLTRLEFDGLRKRSVVQFLYETKLITKDHIALDLREPNVDSRKFAVASSAGQVEPQGFGLWRSAFWVPMGDTLAAFVARNRCKWLRLATPMDFRSIHQRKEGRRRRDKMVNVSWMWTSG
jgi:hypothetical protein